MTLSRGWIRNAVTTPLDARLLTMGLIVCNAAGTPRAGVLGQERANDLVAALGTMNVSVGAAEFVGTKNRGDGVVLFVNDGTVQVAIPAAPPSNSRIDAIWVKHNDNTTGDLDSLPTFGVTSGAAAASPVKPVIPTGAIELATLRIYAGTTAANGGANVLTNTFAMTATRGGTVPFRNLAEMSLWTTATVGQMAIVLDTLATYRWDGMTWRGAVRAFRTKTAAQTINNTTWTTLTWPTVIDSDLGFAAVASGVWTIIQPGFYLIVAQARWATDSAGGQRTIRVRADANIFESPQAVGNATYGPTSQVVCTVFLQNGSTISVEAYQSSGAGRQIGGVADSSFLTIDRIG